MEELLTKFVSALDVEISTLEKEGRDRTYELFSGQRDDRSTGTLYVFVLGDTLRIPDEANGTLRVNGSDLNVTIVSQDGNRLWLLIETLETLPEYIQAARLIVNDTDLLKRLKEKIEALSSSKDWGLAPKVFGFEAARSSSTTVPFDFMGRFSDEGRKVLETCVGSEITIVWGPPGTGKTFTIAALVASLANMNETILVTSHTHAAVEQALWALIEPPSDGRTAGFLYESSLVNDGKILKLGALKSEKIPRCVHLDACLEDRVKEKEQDIRLLENECERENLRLEELKAALVPWQELTQAEAAYFAAQEKRKTAMAVKTAAENQVAKTLAYVNACNTELIKAQGSFFIGRGGRVQKASQATASARKVLTLSEATAGRAEADVIRVEKQYVQAQSRVKQAQLATQNLESIEILQQSLMAAEKRINTLESEITALRGGTEEDAKQLVQNAAAIFATLTKLYIDQKLLQDMKWDTVVVDEVSMAMLPLLAYAASRARKRVVLVGDMYQLPPVINSDTTNGDNILGQDIFTFRNITEIVDSGRGIPQLTRLTTQRRMHPDIVAGAKALIHSYRDLKNDETVVNRTRPSFLAAIGSDESLIVVDIGDLNPWSGKMPGSLSRFNFLSGQVAVELGALYATHLDEPKEKSAPPIGIITPYAAQRRYLNKVIQMFGLERWIVAGTVHTFQGNECDVIIFDSVLGKPHWTSRFTNPNDFHDVRRDLNVALTRARHQFVFVGDADWLNKYAKEGSGFGRLWAFLKRKAVQTNAAAILGNDFQNRVAKTIGSIKGWNSNATRETMLLTEAEFYEYFTADLLKAKHRVVLYTPFIGKTRWPMVAPFIEMLRERKIQVILLHKPLTDPEWKRMDLQFGKQVFHSLARIGVNLIPLSGVHAKTIVIDGEIVYEGSLNWASQTLSYEHMWRFNSPDMAKLIEKMLQLEPITAAFNGRKESSLCPECGGPLILINQTAQKFSDRNPLKLGCARWSEDKSSCRGYLRRVDGRAPFMEPPMCPKGTRMRVNYAVDGRPWDWKCDHKGCKSIRWVNGDCIDTPKVPRGKSQSVHLSTNSRQTSF